MCDAGRIRHHIKHNIYKENCTILFVGYQADGTLGRQLLDGAKDIKIFGERVAVKAKIASLDYFSGHADHDSLMKWINYYKKKPKKIILVHGEPEGLNALKEAIDGIGLNASIAKYKTTFDFNNIIYETSKAVSLPTRKETVGKLSELAKQILELLQKEEKMLKVEDVDKIKLFLNCIHDILTSE